MVNSHLFLPADLTICNFQTCIFSLSFSTLFWKERMAVHHNNHISWKERTVGHHNNNEWLFTITAVHHDNCYGKSPSFFPTDMAICNFKTRVFLSFSSLFPSSLFITQLAYLKQQLAYLSSTLATLFITILLFVSCTYRH